MGIVLGNDSGEREGDLAAGIFSVILGDDASVDLSVTSLVILLFMVCLSRLNQNGLC